MPQYGSPVAQGPALASLMQNGWPSAEAAENFVTAQKRPAWSVQLYFYGPEETVRATWQAAKRRFGQAIPGATFQDGEFLTLPIPKEKEPTQTDKPRLGIPALEVFSMVARNPVNTNDPSDGHADLFITIPRKASAIWESSRVLFEAHREAGMPARQSPFSTPFTYYSRCFFTGTTVPTWRDPAKNARSRRLFEVVMDRCAEHGWASYRTNPAFQDRLISKYSFNNNSLLRFQEKLKDGIDPNGIIAPGRYGIWPAKMRKNRA
jgi:(+)-pinoresinol hydroxylase